MTPILLASLLTLIPVAASTAQGRFLGSEYPIDVEISETAGLFHWVDSLAETSAGKTVPAHWKEFVRRWGRPSRDEIELLLGFRKARLAHIAATGSVGTMLGAFCEASDVEAGVASVGKRLDPEQTKALEAALKGLAPKYREIWDGGAVPRAFVKRAGTDRRRVELASLLAKIASFFEVDPRSAPRPRLVLVPVPDGFGTHAQAVGRNLLLEIRPGDELADQAAVIVHENAHFLESAAPEETRSRLAEEARSAGADGERAWRLLEEALPTALGQGIADQMFRSSWSRRGVWYHREDVDAYAKALHAAANHALATGGRFDASFVRHAVLVWTRGMREGTEILGMDGSVPEPGRSPTPR